MVQTSNEVNISDANMAKRGEKDDPRERGKLSHVLLSHRLCIDPFIEHISARMQMGFDTALFMCLQSVKTLLSAVKLPGIAFSLD